MKTSSTQERERSKIYDFIFGENIGYIEINKGNVRMGPMNQEICPKGICSETGWISKQYQNIVCLPNKVIVEFEKQDDKTIDYRAY